MFKSLSRAGMPSCDDGDGSSRWRSFCRNCRVVLAGGIVVGIEVVVSNLI